MRVLFTTLLGRSELERSHTAVYTQLPRCSTFNISMSSFLPFEIIILIIDVAGENNDIDLLKELALVSQSFLQICTKYIFATVDLHDAVPQCNIPSSKKGFVKLLKNRPDVVKYIRKLTYRVAARTSLENDDHRLSPILPNFLRTISHLNCLTIIGPRSDWNLLNILDSSLISAFLHLMHLPTVNHINLSHIRNFPLSSLTSSVNLHRLDLSYMVDLGVVSPENVQSEMVPKIREFHSTQSSRLTAKLLYAKSQDGRLAFDFMDLRRLSMSFNWIEDDRNFRYLLQNARLLEKLHLSVIRYEGLMEGLLSPTARFLKVLDLKMVFFPISSSPFPPLPVLAGLCEELEAMAGHNVLETLSLEVYVDQHETEYSIGNTFQEVEKVLVKPGWSALRQVSFNVSVASPSARAELADALQSLPDRFLGRISKLESVAFSYSAYVDTSAEYIR